MIANRILVHREHTGNEPRPHILGLPKHTAITIQLRLPHERLATRDRIHGFRQKRRRHVRRRHLHEFYILQRHPHLLQFTINDQTLIGIPPGHGNGLPAQIRRLKDAAVLVHHHRRTIAVTEIDDLDPHPLLPQRYRHRSENERRGHILRTTDEHLLQFRPPIEAHRLKHILPLHFLVDEMRHRTRQVARHRQESHPESLRSPHPRLRRVKPAKVQPAMQHADQREPAGGEHKKSGAKFHEG